MVSSPHFWLLLVCLSGFRNDGRIVDGANLFDWAPSISLTENFGVAEGLCPDIAGWGAGLNCDGDLQLHTCKSQGADTQFLFDFNANEIRTVNYDSDCQSITDNGEDWKGACITINGNINAGDNLRLAACNGGIDQSFELFADGKIRTAADFDLCLAKTSDVGPAGPNERTDFALANCELADPLDITWTVDPPLPIVIEAEPTLQPSSQNFTETNVTDDMIMGDDDDIVESGNVTTSIDNVTTSSENVTTSTENSTTNVENSTERSIENMDYITRRGEDSSASSPFEKSFSFVAMSFMSIFVAFA